MVAHDVIFLNAVTTDTIQLANQHLETFKGEWRRLMLSVCCAVRLCLLQLSCAGNG